MPAPSRTRMAARCARALGELAGAAAVKGDHRQAVDWWRRAADLNPFETDTVLHLAEALIAVGDRAAAVRCAQHHEDTLRAELGLPPDPRVARMLSDLRGSANP